MEVEANNWQAAVEAANLKCPELTPMYKGEDESDKDRPSTISVEEGVWFEGFDQCEIFSNETAAVIPLKTKKKAR